MMSLIRCACLPFRPFISIQRCLGIMVTGCALAACSPDLANESTGPEASDCGVVDCSTSLVSESAGPSVSVCHGQDLGSTIKEIPMAALRGHQGHGDYVARLEVD